MVVWADASDGRLCCEACSITVPAISAPATCSGLPVLPYHLPPRLLCFRWVTPLTRTLPRAHWSLRWVGPTHTWPHPALPSSMLPSRPVLPCPCLRCTLLWPGCCQRCTPHRGLTACHPPPPPPGHTHLQKQLDKVMDYVESGRKEGE